MTTKIDPKRSLLRCWPKTQAARKLGKLMLDSEELRESIRAVSLDLGLQLRLLQGLGAESTPALRRRIRQRHQRITADVNYLAALGEYLLAKTTAD